MHRKKQWGPETFSLNKLEHLNSRKDEEIVVPSYLLLGEIYKNWTFYSNEFKPSHENELYSIESLEYINWMNLCFFGILTLILFIHVEHEVLWRISGSLHTSALTAIFFIVKTILTFTSAVAREGSKWTIAKMSRTKTKIMYFIMVARETSEWLE